MPQESVGKTVDYRDESKVPESYDPSAESWMHVDNPNEGSMSANFEKLQKLCRYLFYVC